MSNWRLWTVVVGAVVALTGGANAGTLQLVDIIDLTGPSLDYVGGLAYRSDLGVLNVFDVETGDGYPMWYRVHRVKPGTGQITHTFTESGLGTPYSPVAGIAVGPDERFVTAFTDEINGIFFSTASGNLTRVYDFQGTEGTIRTKGLAYDGRYLWQAHFSPNVGHIYAIDPATNTRASDIKVDPYPVGLEWDGRFFWVSHYNHIAETGYIAKYDRSGFKLDQFALPRSLAGAEIGDLAINGRHLYAQLPGFDGIAHFAVPRIPLPPPLPPGVTRQGTVGQANISYGRQSYSDSQATDQYDRLPVMASLRRTYGQAASLSDSVGAPGGAAETLATAGTYFAPGDKSVRNISHAMTYGRGQNAPLTADSTLTIDRTMIVPAQPGLGAGANVNARGRLALHGLMQLVLDSPAPSADGLDATLELEVIGKGSGEDTTVFEGTINLEGRSAGQAGPWADVSFGGDLADSNAADILADNFRLTRRRALLDLNDVSVVFRVPAQIRRAFDVEFVIHATTHVPDGADGWGSEVAFGNPAVLLPSYRPLLDAPSYNDGYQGDLINVGYPYEAAVPEPASLTLLAFGLVLFRRRR